MTAAQLVELEAFYNIEPFGEYRDELRNGAQMALMANLKRNPETKPDPWRAVDFMSYVDRPDPEPEREYTDEELEIYVDQLLGI